MFIALLTDFGTKDYFVGAMKGVVLSINPDAQIVDITHDIEPQNIRSAGFTLANCYRDFPQKTIFVSVVDPGVGSDRRAVVVETKSYYFVAPDNGLLSFVLANETDFRAFELTNPNYFRPNVSQTFHGRDIFAPVAAWLSTGIDIKEFGREVSDIIRFEISSPNRISDNEIEAEIIYIDHFGNVITNLKSNDLTERFTVEINNQKIETHQTNYAQAKANELFTIWGSAEYLEIVAYQNSASNILKAEIGDKIIVSFTKS